MLDDDLPPLKNAGNLFADPDERPYFHARDCLKRGNLIGAFEALHVRGRIRETTFDDIDRVLARDYASAHEKGLAEEAAGWSYTATVICSVSFDCERITEAIRYELKVRDILSKDGVLCDRFQPYEMNIDQKADPFCYVKSLLIRPHISSDGFLEGNLYSITDITKDGHVELSNGGRLPLNRPETFDVYRRLPNDLEFCVGDRVRWSEGGHPTRTVANSVTYRVSAIENNAVHIKPEPHFSDAQHESLPIERASELVVPSSGGCLTHAYCQTADTPVREVNCVYNFQAWYNSGPRVADQFRIALTAARDDCYTYTKNVDELRNAVVNASRQHSAIRMLREQQAIERAASLADQRTALEAPSLRLDQHSFTR